MNAAPIKVYVVRHGKTIFNAMDKIQGVANAPGQQHRHRNVDADDQQHQHQPPHQEANRYAAHAAFPWWWLFMFLPSVQAV